MELRKFARVAVKKNLVDSPDYDAVDLSESGMKLFANRKYAKGTKINITLNLPEKPVVVTAEVLWCAESASIFNNGWFFGVRFIGHSISEQLTLRKYINVLLAGNKQDVA